MDWHPEGVGMGEPTPSQFPPRENQPTPPPAAQRSPKAKQTASTHWTSAELPSLYPVTQTRGSDFEPATPSRLLTQITENESEIEEDGEFIEQKKKDDID
ncbi:hypothetical protein N7463_006025 [Penicillium fimorum]|uniref:Uncharacterized protein n=1 Tax=Penicillium fimorum TaxID=1882269 RepID=A0A9X0C697_9EURO|nr:hypothetical protein N7463_006025 [Penicillium fimorum]